MDPQTSLRRRVGDTPLLRAPTLAKLVGLPNLHVKLEGANPTGTQKDRIARLEVGDAASRGVKGVSVASCGNFGVAMAHAAYVHELTCHVFVPEDFRGERIAVMEELGAIVHRAPGSYEAAVQESRRYAEAEGLLDANPGGANTLRTLAGYSRIALEIGDRISNIVAVGLPIGNGSTLAGVHLGFRTAWAQGRTDTMPRIYGGSSAGNNPVIAAFHRGQDRCTPMEPRGIVETEINEPLVNWDALDGTAALTAIQDSHGAAWGFEDDDLMDLCNALLKDGFDAHPASLAAVAALREAKDQGDINADDTVVAVLTSGRPVVEVVTMERPEDVDTFIKDLQRDLGRFGDPANEMREAIETAFNGGIVLQARDAGTILGHCILTPMELSEFFPKFHLSYIAVTEAARGKGVGTVLLEEAIRATDGEVSLHVDTNNEKAIRLYEKFGFNKKYYRMLYKGARTPPTDSATGSGWAESQTATA